ncbi:MAG: ABC transporter permease [Candidatus Margulisiibacteriota bacterium]|jgi:lipooligosaccharide transport system permease protein
MKTKLYPDLASRIYSVWHRHVKVYTKHFVSNAFPPCVEPMIFLGGIGLGLGQYISQIGGLNFMQFLASGLLVTSAMFTSAYECTYGTFIRLEFDKIYDSMLAAPISVYDLIIGEIIWAGTKGFFFSLAVAMIFVLFRVLEPSTLLLAPIAGLFTGLMFGTLSLLVTSFVKNINAFNFYFTGVISPTFFFTGVVFPIENLPAFIRPLAEIFPLTHTVRLSRLLVMPERHYSSLLFYDLAYIALFVTVIGFFAVHNLKKRLID